MSNKSPEPAIDRSSPSEHVAAEVRVLLARRGQSMAKFCASIGRDPMWAVRRLGSGRTVDLTLEEVAQIATALDVELGALLGLTPTAP